MLRWTTAIALLSLLLGCATNPSGRSAFILIDDSSMNQMGATAFTELKGKSTVSGNRSLQAYARCVSDKLIAEMPDQWRRLDWEVVVFDDESPNAFALPGGKVGVHTGLLQVARTEDQLASVIGHELAHVWSRHGAERVSQQFAAQSALAAVEAYGTSQGNQNTSTAMALIGLGAQVGVLLPFSRKHESEADFLGQDLMADAGYDPAAASALWANMRALGGSKPPEFMSTHPDPQRREQTLAERAGSSQMQARVAAARAQGKGPGCPR
jgi:predicted Zn-dependent protease